MAKLRMTYKNLKALRKTREYQALLVDLVAINIVPKSAAESLLGYNIPANLIGGAESSNEEEPTVTESDNTVTLLYFDKAANDNAGEWKTAEYDLTDDPTGEGILDFAKTEFNDNSIDSKAVVEEAKAPDYVDGESYLSGKYVPLDPQPETLESGILIKVSSGDGDRI